MTPTFVRRFRPLTNMEVGRLITHLANSGTSYRALEKFTERMVAQKDWHRGSWVIPLPGDSNLFYVIGQAPEWLVPVPVQQELQWQDPQGLRPSK